MSLVYRWFLSLSLSDEVPHHSTISFNRRTPFFNITIFEDIFDEIVHQATEHKMVGGRILTSASTHIKANLNKINLFEK
jgi:transposase